MHQIIRTRDAVAVASLVLIVAACGSASPSSPTSATPSIDPSVLPAMSVMLADKTLGSAIAPHVIIEYQSFRCPHCAHFHSTTLPALKSQYIDNDVAKYILRDAPFTGDDLDVTASMLARCAGDRYFEAVDALLVKQSTWSGASSESALENVMRQFGMSLQVIDACKASTTLRNGILQMKQDGLNRYQFLGVPAFIVDGVRLVPDGDRDISAFASLLG